MDTPVRTLPPSRAALAPRGALAPGAAVGVRALPPRRTDTDVTPRTLEGLPRNLPVRRPAPTTEPNATVAWRVDLTPSIARFAVRPDGGVPPFLPGQYFALGLGIDGQLVQRPYSTASPSRSGVCDTVEFLVRLVPGGIFTPHLFRLGAGDRIQIGRPKGLFTLRPDDPRTHLFVATGTGLAPFMSMLDALPGRAGGPRAVVIHGVSRTCELAYRDRLERSAERREIRYVPAVSRPLDPANAGWAGATGRVPVILGDVVDRIGLDPLATVAYLCGNPEMIEAAERILASRGFPPDGIVSENYWTNLPPMPPVETVMADATTP